MMKLSTKARNIAVRELAIKLRLEAIFLRELQSLFNRINKSFRTTYIANGSVMDMSTFQSDVTAILRKHYERTQREFRGIVSEQNGQKCYAFLEIKTEEETNDLIELGLLAWITKALVERPAAIIRTTQKNAETSVRQAQRLLLDDEKPIDRRSVGILAAVLNRRKLFGRLDGIGITETQGAAESTKLIEAEAISGRTPFILRDDPFILTRPRDEPVQEGNKQWITVGDSKVRESHISANRQTVEINEAFIVGGAELRHPGDTSLGAPIREIIRCRCSGNFQIKGF
ncbi:MAG: hypothetical protein ACUZ8E_17570 [Candidatus Anammoxibacter sp.]